MFVDPSGSMIDSLINSLAVTIAILGVILYPDIYICIHCHSDKRPTRKISGPN